MTEEQKREELRLLPHLRQASWTWRTYRKPSPRWDHDHCLICGVRIAEDDYGDPDAERGGFYYIYPPEPDDTTERYEWICANCFAELRETFGWRT